MRAAIRSLAALLIMTTCASAQDPAERDPMERDLMERDPMERGRQLAEKLCAHCHATGKWQRSPLVGAPPFRQLEPRVDYDELRQRLQDGIVSGHPAMPSFILSAEEARSMVIYLRAIRSE